MDVLALVEAAYEATLEPSAWPLLLERIAQELRALAVLGVRDDRGQSLAVTWAHGQGAGAERVLDDPLVQSWIVTRTSADGTRRHSGRTLLDAATDEARDWRTPLVRSPGFVHVTTPLLREQNLDAALVLVRDGTLPISPDERQLLGALVPHLSRAVRIAHRLQAVAPAEGEARMALDHLRMGVLVLDADLNVLLANQTAESLFGAASGLGRVHGKLVVADRDTHARLAAHARSCSGAREASAHPAGALRVDGPDDRSLSLLVAPLRVRSRDPAATARAVVFISDPDASVDTPDHLFGSLFGLTAAQARVAVFLMQGHTPQQCAESLGTSLNTVRTHLKRIFEKTGTTRQSELVRLLLTSPAVHHGRPPAAPARRTGR